MAPSSNAVIGFAIMLGVLAQEMGGQQRDIFAPVAQGRQAELDGVQAEQQILAEAALGHLRGQVGISLALGSHSVKAIGWMGIR